MLQRGLVLELKELLELEKQLELLILHRIHAYLKYSMFFYLITHRITANSLSKFVKNISSLVRNEF